MTAGELSTLLNAVDSLGERLDDRIDRLENKLEAALERRDERLAKIENGSGPIS